MKLPEVITVLQKLLDTHGDIEVYHKAEYCDTLPFEFDESDFEVTTLRSTQTQVVLI